MKGCFTHAVPVVVAAVVLRSMAIAGGGLETIEPLYDAIEMLPAGGAQSWALAGDLDLDGRDDLVFLRADDEAIVLYMSVRSDLATRAGAFEAHDLAVDLDNAIHAEIGQLDGDGLPDLAVAVRSGVRVFHGTGDEDIVREGIFLPAIFVSRKVLIADLDGDELDDIVIADEIAGTVRVFLGDGDGNFEKVGDFPPGGEPHDAQLADLDGDGRLDLVVALGSFDLVSVLLGRAGGAFAEASALEIGPNNRFLRVHDIDADGAADLAVSNKGGATVSIARGRGDGTFLDAAPFATISDPEDLVVDDLDGDGAADVLVVGGGESGLASVHYGDGGGRFVDAGTRPCGRAPYNISLVDAGVAGVAGVADGADGAGPPALVVSNAGRSSASLVRLGPNGLPLAASSIPMSAASSVIGAADIDRDGAADILAALRDRSSLVLLSGDGEGRFEQREIPLGGVPVAVAVADLDADGDLDLVQVELLGRIEVLFGRGDGSFAPAAAPGSELEAGLLPSALLVAELTGDGRPDIVVANEGSNDVSILPANADGWFGPSTALPAGTRPVDLASADLNGDGRADLAVLNAGSRDFSVLLAAGEGAFDVVEPLAAIGEDPVAFALVSLGDDDNVDLVIADATRNVLRVFPGSGDGRFGEPLVLATGGAPSALAPSLIDGETAIVVAASSSDGVFVHLGGRRPVGAKLPIAEFAALRAFEVGGGPSSLAIGDFNGDGVPDIVTGDERDGVLSLVLSHREQGGEPTFRRGDVSGEGNVDISDPIAILNFLFLGANAPLCFDAVDVNDDGLMNISDGVAGLTFLFSGGDPPPPPGHLACGVDPTADELDCRVGCPR